MWQHAGLLELVALAGFEHFRSRANWSMYKVDGTYVRYVCFMSSIDRTVELAVLARFAQLAVSRQRHWSMYKDTFGSWTLPTTRIGFCRPSIENKRVHLPSSHTTQRSMMLIMLKAVTVMMMPTKEKIQAAVTTNLMLIMLKPSPSCRCKRRKKSNQLQ